MLRLARVAAITTLLLAIGIALSLGDAGSTPSAANGPVMSFHNRVLLNRLAVNGSDAAEVMVITRPGRLQNVVAHVRTLGGRLRRVEADVDYIRTEIPLKRLEELVTLTDVQAYQLASLASPSWYPDAHSQSRAEIERAGEVAPVVRPVVEARGDLPKLTPEEARGNGYTANADTGVDRWHAAHPTFDGRGVTIAFLESALVEFGHPSLQMAKTLAGADVPKIVGILNTIGPEEPDHTRVDLTVRIHNTHAWHRVDHRTYILPRPGVYRFGTFALPVAKELSQRFAVIREEASGDVWVDSDADGDFQDERPLIDANARLEARHLHVSHPRSVDLAFVFTPGRRADQVHLYTARSGHHTMSISVAAASATDGGLATGVAPGARALVVRYTDTVPQFHTMIEGYLETIRRRDVDILCDSTGLQTVPDAASEFAAIFFGRLIATYRKPIFRPAGNNAQFLSNASAAGDVFTVGGSLGPATFASLYGGGVLPRTVVHPSSASGPTIDGAIKPDFLAPEHRISAGVWVDDGYAPLPKNAPARYLPAGFEISCCTSASSPYAAGLAALLLSAAKQTGTPYSVESLGRALRHGAQFLPDWPAHKQGNGVLDVNATWRELHTTEHLPRIVATTAVSHALTPYVAGGPRGVGILEQDGWVPGRHDHRTLQVRRESGSRASVRYRISWTGNDGTFASASSIALPLDATVALNVSIHARTPGAHSAILNLHDPLTDAVIFRTEATIIVVDPFDARSGTSQFAGQVPLMHAREHFLRLPEGLGAMSIEVNIIEGALSATLLAPDGLYRSYFDHVQPLRGRTFTQGRYNFLWPSPAAGIWSINLRNTSASRESDPSLVSATIATYSVKVRLLGAAIALHQTDTGRADASFTNRFSPIREPSLKISAAKVRTAEAWTLRTALPNLFQIAVPTEASSLRVNLRTMTNAERELELYLYDCTTGECFLWDFALPASDEHSLIVRLPKPGRWLAAVNAAPSPTKMVQFAYEEIIATSALHFSAAQTKTIAANESWAETLSFDRTFASSLSEHALLLELFDAAAAREALAHPWENRREVINLADRPVAVATAVWRLK